MAIPKNEIRLSREELCALAKLFDCLRAGIPSTAVEFSPNERSHLANVDRLVNIAVATAARPATGLNR